MSFWEVRGVSLVCFQIWWDSRAFSSCVSRSEKGTNLRLLGQERRRADVIAAKTKRQGKAHTIIQGSPAYGCCFSALLPSHISLYIIIVLACPRLNTSSASIYIDRYRYKHNLVCLPVYGDCLDLSFSRCTFHHIPIRYYIKFFLREGTRIYSARPPSVYALMHRHQQEDGGKTN